MSVFFRFLGTYVPRLFYFLSAFSPLFIVLGMQAFDDDNLVVAATYLFTFIFSLAAVFYYLSDIQEDDPIRILPQVVKSRDSDVYQFLVAYLIPFLGLDTTSTWETPAFLFLLVLVGLAYIRTETPYINPLLMIVGFHFYEIEIGRDRATRTCGLISRNEDVQPGQPIFAQRRSQFVYVHQRLSSNKASTSSS
jgi:hypothetical protein